LPRRWNAPPQSSHLPSRQSPLVSNASPLPDMAETLAIEEALKALQALDATIQAMK
jgi:hypothetical protein